MCTLNEKVVLDSLLQLVAVKQVLKHTQSSKVICWSDQKGRSKVQSEWYQV
jgi:hypothetical protein